MTGLEPATSGATVRCSTFELHPPYCAAASEKLISLARPQLAAAALAAELIQRADQLMYDAKSTKSPRVHTVAVRVGDGRLIDITSAG